MNPRRRRRLNQAHRQVRALRNVTVEIDNPFWKGLTAPSAMQEAARRIVQHERFHTGIMTIYNGMKDAARRLKT